MAGLGSQSMTILSRLRTNDVSRMFTLEIQQPFNCCNVTALAYAFSALDVPTSVDMIFRCACFLPTGISGCSVCGNFKEKEIYM